MTAKAGIRTRALSTLRVCALGALVAGGAIIPLSSAEGQMRAPMPANQQHACDARLLLLSVRVTDAHGAPVQGAVITVHSIKTGKLVSRSKGQRSINGFYMVMDDTYQQFLGKNGNEYDIVATAGKHTGRARWKVGMDANGCHLARLEGPETIALS